MKEEKHQPRPSPEVFQKFRELRKEALKVGYEDPIRHRYADMEQKYDMSAELFEDGEKWGLKNAIGEVILEPAYDNFKMMTHETLDTGDRVVAQLNDRWGVLKIDGKGSWIMPPEYDYIGYPNTITHAKKDDKWVIMDLAEKKILVDNCESVDEWNGFMFGNDVGFYKKNGKHGVIMSSGQFTEPIFDDIDYDPDLFVKVYYEGKWGYINAQNEFTEDEDDAYYMPSQV